MENITISKLKEYQKFQGDDDFWSRGQKKLNSAEEWYLIRSLMQDIRLAEKELASPEYSERLKGDLTKYCDSEATVQEIKRLALSAPSNTY
jgi:hypothetical protein